MPTTREMITSTRRIDPTSKKILAGGLGLVLLMWLIWLFYQAKLPPEIPLWYSLPYGTNWLSNKNGLMLLPALASGALVINGLFVWGQKTSMILDRLLAWSTLLVSGFFALALVHILILVL